MEPKPKTRRILTDGEPNPGAIAQKLKSCGSSGENVWVSDNVDRNYFNLSDEEKAIIREHGSPTIVYFDGRIETVKTDPQHKDNLDY